MIRLSSCSPVGLFSGLLIIFAGDSTIIQQFQLLGEFLKRRSDFHPVTGDPDAERLQVMQRMYCCFTQVAAQSCIQLQD